MYPYTFFFLASLLGMEADERDRYDGSPDLLADAFEELALECKDGRQLIKYPCVKGPLKKSVLDQRRLVRCKRLIQSARQVHEGLRFTNVRAVKAFKQIWQ